MSYLTKEEMLARAALKTDEVTLPGGGKVRIRELSLAQRSEMGERDKSGGNAGLMAWVVAQSVVDEAGQRVFSDEDIPAIAAGSARDAKTISNAVLGLSRMGEEDEGEG